MSDQNTSLAKQKDIEKKLREERKDKEEAFQKVLAL